MIDFSDQIAELEECKEEFDAIGQRLFDLKPDVPEEDFSTQEMFAISARILYVRYKIAGIIAIAQGKMEQEGGMNIDDSTQLTAPIYKAFDQDNDMVGILIEETVEFKNNSLALSIISRYCDILFSVMNYCRSGDKKHLKKSFRDLDINDSLS